MRAQTVNRNRPLRLGATVAKPSGAARHRSLRWGWLLGLMILAAIVIWWLKRPTPPTVAREDLRYLQLLHTTISSRNLDALRRFESLLQQRLADGAMDQAEVAHFRYILTVAEQADWHAAEKLVRAFQLAQMGRSRPDGLGAHDTWPVSSRDSQPL